MAVSFAAGTIQHPSVAKKDPFLLQSRSSSKLLITLVWRVFSIAAAALVAASVFHHPLGSGWIALGYIAYAALLWRRPSAWFVAVPAALPLLDLSPLTGWLLLNEFDLVVLTTLAVLAWRTPPAGWGISRFFAVVLALVTASYVVSTLIGFTPLEAFGFDSFFTYHTSYNSLRVAKGVFLALALLPFVNSEAVSVEKARDYFCFGVMLGLAGVVGVAAVERVLFTGPFDFETRFRITSTFSSMHTGGQHIDGYLAAVIPFVFAPLLRGRRVVLQMFAAALLAVGAYTCVVTFSRGLYLAVAVSVLVAGVGFFVASLAATGNRLRRRSLAAVVAVVATILLAAYFSPFLQKRLETVEDDFAARSSHWSRVLAIRDPGWITSLFGMGTGSYPRAVLETPPFQYVTDRDDTFLRLAGGEKTYVGQRVKISPHETYELALDLRGSSELPRVVVVVCEKALLYSFECRYAMFVADSPDFDWQHSESPFDVGDIGVPRGRRLGRWSRRPVELAVFNPDPRTTVDMDDIRFVDGRGRDLLVNGDFEEGGNRWFFTSDRHAAWHVENLWVYWLFENGWLGVVSLNLLIGCVYVRLVQRVLRGDLFSVLAACSITGYLVVGLFGSLFEAPQLTTLFFLVVFVAGRYAESRAVPESAQT
jgi:hypothetical protein